MVKYIIYGTYVFITYLVHSQYISPYASHETSAHISHLIFHAHVLNNVVFITFIEMAEIRDLYIVQVRYVINNLLHLVIVKYGVISLIVGISLSFSL